MAGLRSLCQKKGRVGIQWGDELSADHRTAGVEKAQTCIRPIKHASTNRWLTITAGSLGSGWAGVEFSSRGKRPRVGWRVRDGLDFGGPRSPRSDEGSLLMATHSSSYRDLCSFDVDRRFWYHVTDQDERVRCDWSTAVNGWDSFHLGFENPA